MHPSFRALVLVVLVAVTATVAVACGSGEPTAGAAVGRSATSQRAAGTAGDGSSTTTLASPSPSPPTPTTQAPRPAAAVVRPLTAGEVAEAQAQLVEADDCPVPFSNLRMVEVPYLSFEGSFERGTLLLNADVADQVAGVFERLAAARFPIQRMAAIDPLPVDDTDRVSSNITVAFKCRAVRGGSSWSQHAYGHAVDINPVDNPSVTAGVATPPLGADRVDRSLDAPGMIHEGDVVTRAFDEIGWGWGGRWTSHQDYMHFSINGQ